MFAVVWSTTDSPSTQFWVELVHIHHVENHIEIIWELTRSFQYHKHTKYFLKNLKKNNSYEILRNFHTNSLTATGFSVQHNKLHWQHQRKFELIPYFLVILRLEKILKQSQKANKFLKTAFLYRTFQLMYLTEALFKTLSKLFFKSNFAAYQLFNCFLVDNVVM